jgi:hypothetical protein
MRRAAALFPIAFALGAFVFASRAGAQEQGAREGACEIEKGETVSKPASYQLVNNLTATCDCQLLDLTNVGGFGYPWDLR